jgi:hypothetical protein
MHSTMDSDIYFTVHDYAFQSEVETYSHEWERMEEANYGPGRQTVRLPIYIQDGLTEHISSLEFNEPRTQKEERLTKPLPPIPEETKANSRPKPGDRNTIRRFSSTCIPLSRPSRYLTSADGVSVSPLQHRRTSSMNGITDSINQKMTSTCGTTLEHSLPLRADNNLPSWSNPYAHDMRKAGRTSAVTLQRYIDSAYDPDFDSLHSEETSDLDRWASELYGPQDVVMTSLRAPRSNMSLRNVSNELVKAPVTIDNDNRTSRLYQDSTYCSSTSASSYKEDNCTSSENMPAVLAAYSEQWRLQDTETTSFFDFRNDDDASRSASLSVKRPLAKRLWRRMASSLSLRASKVMSI